MISQYRCGTCRNGDDCDEQSSQAVRDVSARCGLCCHSDFPISGKLPEGWLWLRIDPETWGLINCFDKEKTPEKIVKEALYIVASEKERDIQELFRKEIAKWKDEDPIFMSYVYGQRAGRKDGREKVLVGLLDKFRELNRKGNFRPWNIGHIEECINEELRESKVVE